MVLVGGGGKSKQNSFFLLGDPAGSFLLPLFLLRGAGGEGRGDGGDGGGGGGEGGGGGGGGAVLYCVLCCTVLYCILCCTVLYYTVLQCNATGQPGKAANHTVCTHRNVKYKLYCSEVMECSVHCRTQCSVHCSTQCSVHCRTQC